LIDKGPMIPINHSLHIAEFPEFVCR
jgi:hypothetical protein